MEAPRAPPVAGRYGLLPPPGPRRSVEEAAGTELRTQRKPRGSPDLGRRQLSGRTTAKFYRDGRAIPPRRKLPAQAAAVSGEGRDISANDVARKGLDVVTQDHADQRASYERSEHMRFSSGRMDSSSPPAGGTTGRLGAAKIRLTPARQAPLTHPSLAASIRTALIRLRLQPTGPSAPLIAVPALCLRA